MINIHFVLLNGINFELYASVIVACLLNILSKQNRTWDIKLSEVLCL